MSVMGCAGSTSLNEVPPEVFTPPSPLDNNDQIVNVVEHENKQVDKISPHNNDVTLVHLSQEREDIVESKELQNESATSLDTYVTDKVGNVNEEESARLEPSYEIGARMETRGVDVARKRNTGGDDVEVKEDGSIIGDVKIDYTCSIVEEEDVVSRNLARKIEATRIKDEEAAVRKKKELEYVTRQAELLEAVKREFEMEVEVRRRKRVENVSLIEYKEAVIKEIVGKESTRAWVNEMEVAATHPTKLEVAAKVDTGQHDELIRIHEEAVLVVMPQTKLEEVLKEQTIECATSENKVDDFEVPVAYLAELEGASKMDANDNEVMKRRGGALELEINCQIELEKVHMMGAEEHLRLRKWPDEQEGIRHQTELEEAVKIEAEEQSPSMRNEELKLAVKCRAEREDVSKIQIREDEEARTEDIEQAATRETELVKLKVEGLQDLSTKAEDLELVEEELVDNVTMEAKGNVGCDELDLEARRLAEWEEAMKMEREDQLGLRKRVEELELIEPEEEEQTKRNEELDIAVKVQLEQEEVAKMKAKDQERTRVQQKEAITCEAKVDEIIVLDVIENLTTYRRERFAEPTIVGQKFCETVEKVEVLNGLSKDVEDIKTVQVKDQEDLRHCAGELELFTCLDAKSGAMIDEKKKNLNDNNSLNNDNLDVVNEVILNLVKRTAEKIEEENAVIAERERIRKAMYILAVVTAAKKGWLLQQGSLLKSWNKRFVVLDKGILRIFSKPLDSHPHGHDLKFEVTLDDHVLVEHSNTMFEIQPLECVTNKPQQGNLLRRLSMRRRSSLVAESIFLEASSDIEAEDWLEVLSIQMNHYHGATLDKKRDLLQNIYLRGYLDVKGFFWKRRYAVLTWNKIGKSLTGSN